MIFQNLVLDSGRIALAVLVVLIVLVLLVVVHNKILYQFDASIVLTVFGQNIREKLRRLSCAFNTKQIGFHNGNKSRKLCRFANR